METSRTGSTGPTGETIDTPRHRALGSATRVEILTLVRASAAGVTAGEVAARTGRHLSTVRAHLDRLVETGLLVRARASGDGLPGRPPWRYRATPTDPVPAPAPYRALAATLLAALTESGGDVQTDAIRIGHHWGHRLAETSAATTDPVDTVVEVLDGLGFAPRHHPADGDHTEVHLHACPFLELVAAQPDAMCALHLGVVRGTMAQRGVPETAAALEPFGAPTACVVRMAPSPPADPPGDATEAAP